MAVIYDKGVLKYDIFNLGGTKWLILMNEKLK